jgi:hypothetical protein
LTKRGYMKKQQEDVPRTLTRVEKKAVEKVVRTLSAVKGVKFKVVCPDGTEYGGLNSHHKRVQSGRPKGEITNWLKGIVDEAQVGDVVTIPRKEMEKRGYDMKIIRSTVTGYLTYKWGKGSYTSSTEKDGLQLLRIS